jgi:hypothetical protein
MIPNHGFVSNNHFKSLNFKVYPEIVPVTDFWEALTLASPITGRGVKMIDFPPGGRGEQ